LPNFVVGGNTTFDLRTTLPSSVPQGGTFGVSSSGAGLPGGMALAASGLLSVGSAGATQAVGVIFTYAEP